MVSIMKQVKHENGRKKRLGAGLYWKWLGEWQGGKRPLASRVWGVLPRSDDTPGGGAPWDNIQGRSPRGWWKSMCKGSGTTGSSAWRRPKGSPCSSSVERVNGQSWKLEESGKQVSDHRGLLERGKFLEFYSKCIQEPLEICKAFITKIYIHKNGKV